MMKLVLVLIVFLGVFAAVVKSQCDASGICTPPEERQQEVTEDTPIQEKLQQILTAAWNYGLAETDNTYDSTSVVTLRTVPVAKTFKGKDEIVQSANTFLY